MSNTPENNNQLPLMEPCFRADGSFDFGAFFRAPQVIGSLISITVSLLICFLVTEVFQIEGNFINMMVMMVCGLTSLSGAEGIVRYVNAQREARDQGR